MPDGTEIPAPVSTTAGPGRRGAAPRAARAAASPALELRRALLDERGDALARVLGPNACRNPSRSAARPASRSPCVRDVLDLLDRERRLAGQLAAPGQRGVEQLVVLDDAVASPYSKASSAEIGSPSVFISSALAGPTSRAQPLRAAEARDDPEVDLRLAEGRRARRQADVAGHRDLAAAAEREPVDGGDRRDARALPLAPERVDALEVRAAGVGVPCVNALMSAPAQNSAGFAEASTIARAPRA